MNERIRFSPTADGGHSYSQKSPPKSDPVQELWVQLQSMDLEREQDSRNVVCGICMDKVWDKPEGQRIFGILPNCPHAHCLGCLRTWRKSHQHFPLDVIKACPQCRVYSSYIIPHKFWVSEGAEKEQLIRDFRARTSQIRCRYFARGADRCPFKSDCIYLHQLPDEAPSPAPPAPPRPSWSPPGPDCRQLAPGSEMVLGPTALHPTYPTALHPTAVYPSALHPTALHPTVLYPSALLEDQMFLDYNLATAFLGLESYWIAPVPNGGLL
ncbi:probable E3 ubiquitin-protein ligase makorin-1 [Pipistrellus kuhlii]|uniref:RING-type E3 ubiquitin transferase n=1 Tax=Pipistrellus kuhlii TaxID=59472 RepID=A0A7J7YMW8_PIPKU|nr:probable E3 ubiquitin-protein ligase makorin-1 [Pipistrellus kuhlii]KAF6363159.1 hypothetical protein mPipKuh1_010156 [Pipistrellus kuhlii]